MNAKGMATVGFLVLMPLLVSVLAFMAAAYLVIRSDSKSRHVCRVELLKSQHEVSVILNDLLRLNPQASRLRRLRQRADFAEAAARTSPGYPVALAFLTAVKVRQALFAAKQQKLILEGRLKSRMGPHPASRAVADSVKSDSKLYRNAALSMDSDRTAQGGSFSMVATPPDSLTPDYQPAFNFTNTQTMKVKWRIVLGPLLPDWIQKFVSLQNLKLNAECSATLTKDRKTWAPILSADKS